MKVTDLFDLEQFSEMLKQGYVREQVHPVHDLRILNYTEKAQFDQRWNQVTYACRGLIIDGEDNIVARPLPKFFNYDHKETPTLSLTAPVTVMDKADGSLGILYKVPGGGYAIATRGSFASDQAIHATEVLNTKYADWLKSAGTHFTLKYYTPLFEIIYPENRIVLNYGELDDLVLLGMMDILNGQAWTATVAQETLNWTGPVVQEFEYETYGEAIAAPPRENAEGFVVFFHEENMHVKIKQADYIALHKIVTGLSARSIWENLKNGEKLSDLIEKIPDEFHEWTTQSWKDLEDKYDNLLDVIDAEFDLAISLTEQTIGEAFDKSCHRAAFAHYAKMSPFKGFLFSILDEKNFYDKVWDMVKPEVGSIPTNRQITENNT